MNHLYPSEYAPPGQPTPASTAATEDSTTQMPRVTAVLSPPAPLDPRVVAFGTGTTQADPPVVRHLVRWALPVVTGAVGVLLGIALGSGGDRPTAPVTISEPAVTESVTATQRVSLTRTVQPATVTRRVTETSVRVSTAAPEPPEEPATVTVTERRTITVPLFFPRPRNRG